MVYIAEANKLTDWYPEDAKEQAKVNFWLHWNHTNTRHSTLDMIAKFTKGQKINTTVIKKSLDFMEARLGAAGPFLAGAKPTIADLFILPEIDQIVPFKFFEL